MFKETLQTLEAQKLAGEISEEQFDTLYAEMARDLLEVPSSAATTTDGNANYSSVTAQNNQAGTLPLLALLLVVALASSAPSSNNGRTPE